MAVRALLQEGADILFSSLKGWVPLYLAAVRGHIETVQLLLDSDAIGGPGWEHRRHIARSLAREQQHYDVELLLELAG